MGSSGIALVGFGFRLSFARWRNRCSDSNSNSIMANTGSIRKLDRLNDRYHEIANTAVCEYVHSLYSGQTYA
jgi:hypothetical protein